MKADKQIYLLYRDHSIGCVPTKRFANQDLTNVWLILFPVRVYDDFIYVPVEISTLVRPFYFEFDGVLMLDSYAYGEDSIYNARGTSEKVRDIHLRSNTQHDFYRIIASLYSLKAVNEVINPDLIDEYYIYSISNCHILIKYDDDFIIDDYPAVSSYRDMNVDKDEYSSNIAFLLRHIERLVTITRDGRINPKPPSLIMDMSQYEIHLANDMWSHLSFHENDASSQFMRSFGLLAFIDQSDMILDILSQFYDFKITYQFVHYNEDLSNIPLPDNDNIGLTCDDVDDNPEFFEVMYDGQISMYMAHNVIEIVSNLKYIMHAIKMYADCMYGKICDNIIFTLYARFNGDMVPSKYKEFKYGFNFNEIDKVGNAFSTLIYKLLSFWRDLP